MNYLEIIVQGFFNKANRENLADYFISEWENSEKKLSANLFFDNCLNIINDFQYEISRKYIERKEKLTFVVQSDNFSNEIRKQFKQELEALNKNDFSVTLPAGGHLWNEDITYIKNAIFEAKEQVTAKPARKEKTKPEITKLSQAFEDISKYKKIMEILVKNGYCQPNTYFWIDSKKSNKSTIVFLIKILLHAQGYYKENKRPANKEVQIMAKNTFGCDISESYIKQSKNEDKAIQKIIPPASSLVY